MTIAARDFDLKKAEKMFRDVSTLLIICLWRSNFDTLQVYWVLGIDAKCSQYLLYPFKISETFTRLNINFI